MAAEDTSNSKDNSALAALFFARPAHPFYGLPPELVLDIIDLLPPEDYINFAFANYPLLQAYSLAPALSGRRIDYLTTRPLLPSWFQLLRVPTEITLQIMGHLGPSDIMAFVLANYQNLESQGIAPSMSDETIANLWQAIS